MKYTKLLAVGLCASALAGGTLSAQISWGTGSISSAFLEDGYNLSGFDYMNGTPTDSWNYTEGVNGSTTLTFTTPASAKGNFFTGVSSHQTLSTMSWYADKVDFFPTLDSNVNPGTYEITLNAPWMNDGVNTYHFDPIVLDLTFSLNPSSGGLMTHVYANGIELPMSASGVQIPVVALVSHEDPLVTGTFFFSLDASPNATQYNADGSGSALYVYANGLSYSPPVPEPSTYALFGAAGLIALAISRRYKQAKLAA